MKSKNQMIYALAAAAMIIIVAAALIVSRPGGPSTTVTTTAAQTTLPATTSTNTTYKTTTAAPVNATGAGHGCTAQTYYTCSNFTYSYAPASKTYNFSATISQNTGTSWSGFGIGFAPQGTVASQGVPEIAFYALNSSSTNPVGPALLPNKLAHIWLSGSGNATTVGTLWACFVNSGLVYVGKSGCVGQGGVAAQYAEIATIRVS